MAMQARSEPHDLRFWTIAERYLLAISGSDSPANLPDFEA